MGICRLKDKGRIFRETFLGKLGLLLRGTVAAPPERFGETIEDERIRGGEFACSEAAHAGSAVVSGIGLHVRRPVAGGCVTCCSCCAAVGLCSVYVQAMWGRPVL